MNKYVEGCDAGEKDQAVLLAEIQLLREKTEVSDMRWLDRDTRAAAVAFTRNVHSLCQYAFQTTTCTPENHIQVLMYCAAPCLHTRTHVLIHSYTLPTIEGGQEHGTKAFQRAGRQ